MKNLRSRFQATGAICASLLLLLTAATGASAQNANPPGKVAYQGFLTDVDGIPLGNTTPTNVPMVFRIFAASSGGNPKWSSQQTVTIDKGHFSVLLGEGSPFASEPFAQDLSGVFTGNDASDRFLEMSIGSPLAAITPRIQFLPGPYALLARSATQLLDTTTGNPVLSAANGVVNLQGTVSSTNFAGNGARLTGLIGTNIVSGTISSNQLAADSVDSARILDGTILNADIGATAAIADTKLAQIRTSGKVADSALSGNIATRNSAQTFASSPTAPQTFSNFDQNSGSELDILLPAQIGNPAFTMKLGIDLYNRALGFSNTRGGDAYIQGPAGRRLFIQPGPSQFGMMIDENGRFGLGSIATPFFLSVGGDAGKPGGGSWSNFSDRRIKKNISTITNALEQISRLRGVNFEWRNPEDHANQQGLQGGFIAQEIEAVFPNWVSPVEAGTHDKALTEDGKVRSVSLPFEFDAVLVEAVKELKAGLAAKDAEVAELREEVTRMRQERKTLSQAVADLQARDEAREARLIRLEKSPNDVVVRRQALNK